MPSSKVSDVNNCQTRLWMDYGSDRVKDFRSLKSKMEPQGLYRQHLSALLVLNSRELLRVTEEICVRLEKCHAFQRFTVGTLLFRL